MVRGLGIAFLFLFLCLQSFGKPSAAKFREVYDAYLEGEETQEADHSYVQQFDYLFFAGFGGVKFKPLSLLGDGYFDLLRKEVRRHGVPSRQVPWTYYPPSSKSIAQNGRDYFAQVIEKRVSTHGKKLVLFGHSKGAVELFSWAVTHPEFVRDHVEAMIFISGAFQGSALANLVKGRPNNPVPLHVRVPATLAAAAVWPYINFFWSNGLESLTTEAASEHLSTLLHSDADAVNETLNRSLFIQTETKGLDRSPIIWLPDYYLRSESKEASDGLVTVSAQLPTAVPEAVLLSGVSHFSVCPQLISWHFFSRIPRALAFSALASLSN